MNNQIFLYVFISTCTKKKHGENMSINVEVLNKSSCFIYGRERRCSNKMTTNKKQSINKDKLKCVRMKHKKSPLHKFLFSFLHFIFLSSKQHRIMRIFARASERNLSYAGVFTLFHPSHSLIKLLPVTGEVHFRQKVRQVSVWHDAYGETSVRNSLCERHANVNLQI